MSQPIPEPSSCVDFVGVGLNATDTVLRLSQFPKPDSKMEVLEQYVLLGGQVATAAIACRRWGWRTRYIGKIGDDLPGRLHRAAFAEEGVEAHLVEVPHCASQTSYILVDQSSGERTILWQHNPKIDIAPEELRQEWITSARLLHVDGHPCAAAIAAARWARAARVVVTADLDNLYPGVQELLQLLDYAITSREFPARLTGNFNLLESLPQIAREYGCGVTGATLGRDGALAWDGHVFHHCPGFKVPAIDTTGSGDIFHAGMAHALLNGQLLDNALEFSCAAAALNCTALGARGGIRPIAEIEQLVRSGKRAAPLYSTEELSRHNSSVT